LIEVGSEVFWLCTGVPTEEEEDVVVLVGELENRPAVEEVMAIVVLAIVEDDSDDISEVTDAGSTEPEED
jgi:hypothetical protein